MKNQHRLAALVLPLVLLGFAATLPAPCAHAVAAKAPKTPKHKPEIKDVLVDLDKEVALAQDALGAEPKFQDAAVHFEKAWSQSFGLKAVAPAAIAKDAAKKKSFDAGVDRLAEAIKQGQTAANGGKLDAAKTALGNIKIWRDKIAALGEPEAKPKPKAK